MTCTSRQLIALYYQEMTQHGKISYRKPIKLSFVKKTSSLLYPVERIEIIKSAVRVTPEVLCSTIERSAVEQGRFLKRE